MVSSGDQSGGCYSMAKEAEEEQVAFALTETQGLPWNDSCFKRVTGLLL